ncbi:hypothetical protein AYI68_g5324, partial [Smittium mucronatum]
MKVIFTGLALALSGLMSTMATPSAATDMTNESEHVLAKRDGGRGNGGHGRGGYGHGGYGRGRYGGRYGGRYYGYGRYWDFDNYSDDVFISGLTYRPSNYYGQRFQYLYSNAPDFRRYWNSDLVFRRRWDSDLYFRNSWFANYYPYGYDDYR